MSGVTLKITSLLIRTLSKPIANYIKAQAREHPKFRKRCIQSAQAVHRFDMKLRLGLLQDTAAIDKQLAREAKEAQLKKQKHDTPTVKTEAETKADQAATAKEKESGTKKAKSTSQSETKIRPLSEAKAIDTGATFISETFLFAVALGTIMFEAWRSRRKENTRREDVAEKLRNLEEQDKAKWQLLDELQREVDTLRAGSKGKPAPSTLSISSKKTSSPLVAGPPTPTSSPTKANPTP
ncbi:hypothetical protein MMC13_007748 [Lambiella insularis]|nr:hypothetical protein [Lambiella insularis]